MTLKKSSNGFTLIELMIVVVIVGVLTLVAYPAYQRFVVKANRAEAKSHLMNLAQKQQLYFNDSRTYATKTDLNADPPDGEPKRVTENYTVAVAPLSGPPPTFTITATPIAGKQQEDDGVLSIDNTGEKLHAGEAW